MAFDDLKDQLSEQFSELKGRIEESAAFNSLRERYENLSPGGQRGLIVSVSLFILFIMMYIPYSYFSTSGDYVAEYNDKRQTIRKLLQASRIAATTGPVSNPPPADALRDTIQNRLSSFALLPEQMTSITAIPGSELGGGFAPAGISQEGVRVVLNSLNIKQVVDIGYDLQNMMQGVRLVGLVMNANQKDGRYFDVSYKVARFSIPGADSGGMTSDEVEDSGAANTPPPRPADRPRFNPPPANEGSIPPPPSGNSDEVTDEEGFE